MHHVSFSQENFKIFLREDTTIPQAVTNIEGTPLTPHPRGFRLYRLRLGIFWLRPWPQT